MKQKTKGSSNRPESEAERTARETREWFSQSSRPSKALIVVTAICALAFILMAGLWSQSMGHKSSELNEYITGYEKWRGLHDVKADIIQLVADDTELDMLAGMGYTDQDVLWSDYHLRALDDE